ncbi:hypothetical protein [Ekhidna sp.]|uniref:hypothetical protein n=1 Tax=Ekhidna sp. TaxID=2608089 RepID=UPI003B5C46E3
MKFGCVIVCVLILVSCNKSEPNFDFISVDRSVVATTHRLSISLKLRNDFEPFGEHDFVESHDGVPFKVSTATFLSSNEMIILLAEEHLDPKGRFTYDLPVDTLNGMNVYRRVGCFNLFDETEQDLRENAYLRFLKREGFDFQQGLNMVQFILLNDEKSAEVVLSYVELLPECPEIKDQKNLILKGKNTLSDFSLLNE